MSGGHSTAGVGVEALRRSLADAQAGTGELALLDIREEGQFGEGHALLAVNTPYSRLELEIPTRVPNRNAPVVLIAGDEADDALARRAARRLRAVGYSTVSWLQGGINAWGAAGEALVKGVNVPSKAFAECVELAFHTPAIQAEDLDRRRRAGEKIVVLDSRTAEEHARFHVPGAISCPSAELALRVDDLVPPDTSLLVVSCAGRTRGIIGAQALINAGVELPIAALEGGTQGWRLAGFETVPGADAPLPPPSAAALAGAAERARSLTERFAIPHVDHATLAAWRQDETRTTYTFDVRTPPDYARGHLPGFINVAGGQLVQTLDQWAGTRGARIVLSDDAPTLRATVTAHWLRQLGWNAVVLDAAHDGVGLQTQVPASADPHPAWNDLPTLTLEEADRWLAEGALALDLGASAEHATAHVPGSRWASRARLASALAPRVDSTDRATAGATGGSIAGSTVAAGRPVERVLLVSDDDRVARLAALDLQELADQGLFKGRFAVLRGGTRAWRASGRALASSAPLPASERIDMLFWLHDRHDGNAEASRAYLEWEEDLPRQVGWPHAAPFRIGPRLPDREDLQAPRDASITSAALRNASTARGTPQ